MKFPDFIIIGAMKCGTTALWHNLNRHSSISMGKNWHDPKRASTEIRFFNNGKPYKNWEKGAEWYKSLFEGTCCGEKSANYIESKEAMRRISDLIPQVKLILCVRNPVDRAYSEHNMYIAGGKKRSSINAVFSPSSSHRKKGNYMKILRKNVFPFFDREQLHIVIQERMKAETNQEMNKIYEFLGLAPYYSLTETVHAKERDQPVVSTNRGFVPGVRNNYKTWATEYPPLKSEIRRKLIKSYKADNEELFEFLGFRVQEWDS